jgi:hypothetical protein
MLARPLALTQLYLAGFAAEHLLAGRRPRQYIVETGLAILAHTDPALVSTFEGIETSDGHGAIQHLLRTGVRPVEEELRQEVDRLYEIARASVSAVWAPVRALAQALLIREELDREGFNEALGDADIYLPVLAVQRAHGLLGAVPPPPAATTNGRLVEASMKPAVKAPGRRRNPPPATSAGVNDRRTAAFLKALRADRKFSPVIDAYERQAGEGRRKFGSNGLKVNGRLFALLTQGTLVVKLPKERVAGLAGEGVGKPFDPGHGRLMKEWLTVTSPKASWIDLVKEAHDFVKASGR